MHIAIIGIGAMGCLFGAKLSQVAEVTLLGHWPAQLAALRENGLRLIDPDGRSYTLGLSATNDPKTASPADLALILVKSYQTPQAAATPQQLLAPHGVALTLQNGLGNLEQLTAALCPQRASLGITSEGAALLAPGVVHHAGIRGGGLVGSLKDIERIVMDNRRGTPILIRDLASVKFGAANRFGAITANSEGEKVLGQVMMLKDANSGEVINNVKKRVAEIQSSLPEGVFVNGFLERSELIAKTTFTITENLILGCLIVIMVVVLLLGNFRSGLVVASVIPLSLLFALSMMYIFGVDANLMSLGAIDFGIIIDGAVIIVEYISFQMMTKMDQINLLPQDQKQGFIDKITHNSAHKMMRSAVFGQIIIIIVFIPILSLSGVEGKMFKPMAMTFSFALIGAMLLCFTYVPVVSALFIKGVKEIK